MNIKEYLQDWPAIVLGLFTFLGALVAYWKRIKRKFFQAGIDRRKKLRQISDCSEALLTLAGRESEIVDMIGQNAQERALLVEIGAALKPNGGSSLFDAVTRIEKDNAINSTVQRLLTIHDIEMMFWTDAQGRYTRASKAYAELVNRTSDEMLGDGWKSHIAAHCRKAVAEEWSYAVKEKRDFYMRMDILDSISHTLITVDVVAAPAKVQGEVVGYVGRLTLVEKPLQNSPS